VHADDVLACDGWPVLCTLLPRYLLGDHAIGAASSSASPRAAAETAAAALLQRLSRTLLGSTPAALAQLMSPLLQRLQDRGVCGAVCDGGAPLGSAERRSGASSSSSPPAAEAAEAAEAPAVEQQTVAFALRALHALGRQWHFLPPDDTAALSKAITLTALGFDGAPDIASSAAAAAGAGQRGGAGAARAPALQALQQLDAEMLWWSRLMAVAAFKRGLIEEGADAAGDPTGGGAAGEGGGGQLQREGGRSAFAAALLPVWRGERGLQLRPWQRAAAANVTRSLLASSHCAFAALMGCGVGGEAAEVEELARGWMSVQQQQSQQQPPDEKAALV